MKTGKVQRQRQSQDRRAALVPIDPRWLRSGRAAGRAGHPA